MKIEELANLMGKSTEEVMSLLQDTDTIELNLNK